MRIQGLTVNLLLVFGSLILGIGALEGILRVGVFFDLLAVGHPAPPANHHHTLCCEYDPQLGWRHVPNRTIKHIQREYTITESFNSRGARGPEYALDKPPGMYRIVVIGDSFAEGFSVEFEDLFSEILKQRLNDQLDQRFEVINLGVAGYSTDQELLLYRTEGKRYNPDLTILILYDNDVWFTGQAYYSMMRRGHKPLFTIVEGKLKLTHVPVPPPVPQVDSKSADLFLKDGVPFRIRIKSSLEKYSYLYRWIRQRIKNTASLYSLAQSLGIAEPPEAENPIPMPKQYGVYQDPYTPEIRNAWTVTEALLAELKKETRSVGSELVVFHAPLHATVYAEDWERFKRNYGLTADGWNRDRVNQELGEVLERLKIDFLNPVKLMRQQAKVLARDGERLYYEGDIHWNRNGNGLVGEMLADFIQEHYLVREEPGFRR